MPCVPLPGPDGAWPQQVSGGTPAKWLREKRLTHVKILSRETLRESLVLKGRGTGSKSLQTLDSLSFG